MGKAYGGTQYIIQIPKNRPKGHEYGLVYAGGLVWGSCRKDEDCSLFSCFS